MADYTIVFSILFATLILFATSKLRYDYIAILALLASVFLGVVPANDAFSGFSHPAVITVAAVLVITKALQNSGVVTFLAQLLSTTRTSEQKHITANSILVAFLSSIMNNVGALALMLPVALQNATKEGHTPSRLLMPLSFASLLGGLVTLIGTPTNIVISSYREEFTGTPFSMFDFTPVGIVIAAFGLVYISLVGWRLLPERISTKAGKSRLSQVREFTTEVKVPDNSPLSGLSIRQLEQDYENELTVMALLRNKRQRLAPDGNEKILSGDILVLEGDPGILEAMINDTQLSPYENKDGETPVVINDNVRIAEMIVLPNSSIESQSVRAMRIHDRYGVNLLALSRKGREPQTRLANTRFKTGDILLLQGSVAALDQVSISLGLLGLSEKPAEERASRQKMLFSILIFGVAILLAASGVLSVPIAFVSAVAALIATKSIHARDVYRSIDWSIIVLLGSLIPVGTALQTSGGTDLIARALIDITTDMPLWAITACLLVSSMWLSDIIPNTPVAVLMAPIGATIAAQLGISSDPFLMAVAIGCATPFLTPIGHQSNTLVMSPGGYRFTDYARMGLGLELVIIITAVPAIMWIWPA